MSTNADKRPQRRAGGIQTPSTMVLDERDALIGLYNATGGSGWLHSENWNTDADLSLWHGVEAVDGRVVSLSLPSNNLRGEVLRELGQLTALTNLNLQSNRLTGPIPRELGALGELQRLALNSNQLTGSIPKELGTLTKLSVLWLFGNHLTGQIPPELGNLGALQHLSLYGNELGGSVPDALGALVDLQELHLNRNQLSGDIPTSLGQLGNLQQLSLFQNELSGPIPVELGGLAALKKLWLEGNQLTGPIPPELGNLTSLAELNLRQNRLSGSIPPELGNLAALVYVHIGGNQLSDAPDKDLTGPSLARWKEKLKGAARQEPWAISCVELLVSLWHFLVPILDDVTDLILLMATFEDRGGLWRACWAAFVLADVERVLLSLVTWLLVLGWIPFALVGDNATRGERFGPLLTVLNGGRHLRLEEVYPMGVQRWGNPSYALRWPILDGFLWGVVGSRSKSSALMRLWGMEGNTSVQSLEQSGFGLSLINRIVDHHPYSTPGRIIFFFPPWTSPPQLQHGHA
ncbi:unnamed protein product [Scytosiphon promiscuus]